MFISNNNVVTIIYLKYDIYKGVTPIIYLQIKLIKSEFYSLVKTNVDFFYFYTIQAVQWYNKKVLLYAITHAIPS